MQHRTLKLSVTTLADFACRTGDLEFSGPAGPTAREGMRAHQQLQAERTCETEFRVAINTVVDEIDVSLGGRIDIVDTDKHALSEIKSTLVPAVHISESQRSLHWSQAMLYGYCYWQQLQVDNAADLPEFIEIELIYFNIRANEKTSEARQLAPTEFTLFAEAALQRYVRWRKILWAWQDATTLSAKELTFPYDQFRDGQRDMAAAVYRTVRDREALLCEAPTGIGKTISALFPVIKAIGDGHVQHAVYLTAKTSGRTSAMQAVRLLEREGLKITAVQIRSKQPTCFCSNGRCDRNDAGICPMTVGFFDKLPDAREEAIALGVIAGEQLDEIAWNYQLCPFELALQLLPWTTLAVCDFNYVFDPLVRLGRFNEPRRDTVLLVDEAHNLLDRSRNMHSGMLLRSHCSSAATSITLTHPVLAKRLDSLARALMKQGKPQASDSIVLDSNPDQVAKVCAAFVEAYMEATGSGPALPDGLFEMFKEACRYIAINELFGDQHRALCTTSTAGHRKQVELTLKCLDASMFLEKEFRLFRASIVFSATLRPAAFYRRALGLPTDTRQLVLGSPFDPAKAMHRIVSYIDTRYRQRQASSHDLIVLLASLYQSKPGNYMVFFPSYAYMQQVHDVFVQAYPDIHTWTQARDADNETREQQMQSLQTSCASLGFAILGGVFGEGVDYVGDLLIGAVLVGVGLPATGVEQDLIAEHYRSNGLDGFDYAYRYPGFTRVLQTAGRVIRSESDKGIVLLVDDRFNQQFYRSLYPAHWQVQTAGSLSELELQAQEFWNDKAKK